jgi:hypothetical protein
MISLTKRTELERLAYFTHKTLEALAEGLSAATRGDRSAYDQAEKKYDAAMLSLSSFKENTHGNATDPLVTGRNTHDATSPDHRGDGVDRPRVDPKAAGTE